MGNKIIFKQKSKILDGSNTENSFKMEKSEESLFKSNTALIRKKFKIEKSFEDFQITEIKIDGETLLDSRIKRNYKKNFNDINLISSALKEHFILKYLNDDKIEELIDFMLYATYSNKECVYKQGEPPQNFFIISTLFINSLIIIEKGSFIRIFNEDTTKTHELNKTFGFKSIFYDKTRTSSIYSNEESEVFILEKNYLKNGLLDIRNCLYDQMRPFLGENRIFNYLDEYQRDNIYSMTTPAKFSASEIVLHENESSQAIFIIKKGVIEALDTSHSIGSFFGEEGLNYHFPYANHDYIAGSLTTCLIIPINNLIDSIGENIYKIKFEKKIKEIIKNSNYFSVCTKDETCQILENLEIFELNSENWKKEAIIKQNEKFLKTNFIFRLDPFHFQILNEEFFFGEKEENDSYDEIEFNGFCGFLKFSAFCKIMNYQSQIDLNKQRRVFTDLNKDPSLFNLQNFVYLKSGNESLFGTVLLTKNLRNNKFYTLLPILKSLAVQKNLERHAQQTKEVIETIKHPFILNYNSTIRHNQNLFFVMDFERGTEFIHFIRNTGLLQKSSAQFYVAQIILALQYLHKKCIIYRDLKPESFLIDEYGYLKFQSFNFSKLLSSSFKTYTLLGVPHYMAPEMITGKGYSYSIDLWALGVFTYELLCGGLPFGEEEEDPFKVYEAIIKSKLDFPNFLIDPFSKEFISLLLNKVAELRLGGTWENLKSHRWLASIEWEKIERKEVRAPYLPEEDLLLPKKEFIKMMARHEMLEEMLNKGV